MLPCWLETSQPHTEASSIAFFVNQAKVFGCLVFGDLALGAQGNAMRKHSEWHSEVCCCYNHHGRSYHALLCSCEKALGPWDAGSEATCSDCTALRLNFPFAGGQANKSDCQFLKHAFEFHLEANFCTKSYKVTSWHFSRITSDEITDVGASTCSCFVHLRFCP